MVTPIARVLALVAAAALVVPVTAAATTTPNPLQLEIAAGPTSAGPFRPFLKVKSGATMDLRISTGTALPAGDVLAVEWQEGKGPWHYFATCTAAPCDELAKQTMATTTRFRAVVKASRYSLRGEAISTSPSASVSWTR